MPALVTAQRGDSDGPTRPGRLMNVLCGIDFLSDERGFPITGCVVAAVVYELVGASIHSCDLHLSLVWREGFRKCSRKQQKPVVAVVLFSTFFEICSPASQARGDDPHKPMTTSFSRAGWDDCSNKAGATTSSSQLETPGALRRDCRMCDCFGRAQAHGA